MREKLIELMFVGQLLADAECDKQAECNKCRYNAPNACREGFIADHLIANDVTIQETGYWEWDTEDIYKCSHCGDKVHVKEVMGQPDWGFCPACGARMLPEPPKGE